MTEQKQNKSKFGAADFSTHHLLLLKEVPDSLIALRKEILNHPDIREQAERGSSFEECLGIIAAKLDIVLEGSYDVGPLCEVLVEALQKRGSFSSLPHLRNSSLIDVELLEKEGTVEIVERDRSVVTIVPDGGIITSTVASSLETVEGDTGTAEKNNPPD